MSVAAGKNFGMNWSSDGPYGRNSGEASGDKDTGKDSGKASGDEDWSGGGENWTSGGLAWLGDKNWTYVSSGASSSASGCVAVEAMVALEKRGNDAIILAMHRLGEEPEPVVEDPTEAAGDVADAAAYVAEDAADGAAPVVFAKELRIGPSPVVEQFDSERYCCEKCWQGIQDSGEFDYHTCRCGRLMTYEHRDRCLRTSYIDSLAHLCKRCMDQHVSERSSGSESESGEATQRRPRSPEGPPPRSSNNPRVAWHRCLCDGTGGSGGTCRHGCHELRPGIWTLRCRFCLPPRPGQHCRCHCSGCATDSEDSDDGFWGLGAATRAAAPVRLR